MNFYRQLSKYGVRIALLVVPLFLLAYGLDLYTAGSGIQYRLNVHFSILFVELMVWARYGNAIVIAAARWAPATRAAAASSTAVPG